MKKAQDLTGRKFNRLLVLSRSKKRDNQKKILWNCKCDCGNKLLVRRFNLFHGIVSCGCYRKEVLKREDVALTQRYAWYKRDSGYRKLKFSLTKAKFNKIIQQKCFYCGENPKNWSPYLDEKGNLRKYIKVSEEFAKTTSIPMNGIDRLNNHIGYNIRNCVPCCSTCNNMKNIHSYTFFVQHIEKILNNRKLLTKNSN